MKRIIALILAMALLSACAATAEDVFSLSFSDAVSFEAIKALDGKKVSIIGYMATLSPVSGKFIYLMNMPYQSCPFCVPNTTQLSNTMAVYAPEGETFDFTDQAVRITGTMQVEDFEDEFGYTYNYRIKDAIAEEIDLSEVTGEYSLWQTLASDGIVAEVNAMLDYVYFVCQWTEYSVSYYDEDGSYVFYYLYPGDVEMYLADDGLYGYADKADDGYFPGLVKRARAISETELEDLVEVIERAKEVEVTARQKLADGAFTYDEVSDKYILDDSEELYQLWADVYLMFSNWLTKWTM